MKASINVIYKHSLLFLISFMITGTLMATNGPRIEKKKGLEKRISVSKNQKIEIENSFGTVTVTNHPGNEMHLRVTAIVQAPTEQRAQEMLDNISLEFTEGRTIRYETEIKGSNGSKKGKTHMEINVELSLPQENPLDIENSFGATILPDRNGVTEIEQKFGDLETGKLSNVKQISVEFGSMKADALTGGKASYKYSDIQIGALHGSVLSSFEFCKVGKIGFSNDLSNINIKSSYSDLEINLPAGFSGDFNIRTSFGDLINRSVISISEDKDDEDGFGPKFDKEFFGKSGSGKCSVLIKSSFGKIKLN